MRELIAARLAQSQEEIDPRARFLANVVGPTSAGLLELLERPGQRASVLMPIIDRPTGPVMLFTERAPHLAHHPGQVAFPGGRMEAADPSPEAAALREAQEEVGLAPARVDVVGRLGPHMTGTGFIVTPVVGVVAGDFEAAIDPAEVAAVFEVPLGFLLDPANRTRQFRDRFDTRFVTYEYRYEGWRIWGATAAMVVSLQELLMKT